MILWDLMYFDFLFLFLRKFKLMLLNNFIFWKLFMLVLLWSFIQRSHWFQFLNFLFYFFFFIIFIDFLVVSLMISLINDFFIIRVIISFSLLCKLGFVFISLFYFLLFPFQKTLFFLLFLILLRYLRFRCILGDI